MESVARLHEMLGSKPCSELSPRLTALLEPLGQRVAVVVNYDTCSILPPLIDDYSAMVKRLTDRFYSRVTRYGTGGFLKARLEALKPLGD